MPKVKFTKVVNDKRFGGQYVTPYFTARKGDVVVMTGAMAKQILTDHKGLIQVTGKDDLPPEGKVAEVVEQAPRPKEDGEPEDEDASHTAAPRGLDRMLRGGHTKS
ncbi:hypothetical protein KAW64_07265 [bacterium]|nr:hypothetical protein [bacterium]